VERRIDEMMMVWEKIQEYDKLSRGDEYRIL
jgi:hypothetical protein